MKHEFLLSLRKVSQGGKYSSGQKDLLLVISGLKKDVN